MPIAVANPLPPASYVGQLGARLNDFVASVAIDSSDHGQAVFVVNGCSHNLDGKYEGIQVGVATHSLLMLLHSSHSSFCAADAVGRASSYLQVPVEVLRCGGSCLLLRLRGHATCVGCVASHHHNQHANIRFPEQSGTMPPCSCN